MIDLRPHPTHPSSNPSTCLAEAMELCIAGNVEESHGACWAHHLREEATKFHVLNRFSQVGALRRRQGVVSLEILQMLQ